jgi:hypothetical protein
MSLIHFDKSVITFHFKEILEDGLALDPWSLAGLGAMLVAPVLLNQRHQNRAVPLNVWIEQARQTTSPHLSLAQHHGKTHTHNHGDRNQETPQQMAA